MVDVNEKERIVQEVFAITGMAVPENDALVLAALFYSHKLQETARDAVSQINMASASTRAVIDAAAALVQKSATNNKVLPDTIESRVKKAVREASRIDSSGDGPPTGWRGVLAGIAFGILLTGGVVGIACNFNRSLFSDARLGAEWRWVLPTLPPDLRDKLIVQSRLIVNAFNE